MTPISYKPIKLNRQPPEWKQRIKCTCCGEPVLEIYMVTREVWGTRPDHSNIHYGCLEKELGRNIRCADLIEAPCNDIAKRLLSREPINLIQSNLDKVLDWIQ